MTDHAIDVRRRPLRRLHTDAKGNHHLGGRWSLQRVADYLIENPHKRLSLDELARFVYGTTSPKYRDNVRKHIPSQRKHMLNRDVPFVTEYGERGRVQSIKLYQRDEIEDGRKLHQELDRALMKKEISQNRYDHLCRILALPPPLIINIDDAQ